MRRLTGSHTILIPELHSGQSLIKSELKDRNIICAHRGWRKSSFGIHLAVEHMLTGHNVGWFANTFNVITGPMMIDFNRVSGGQEDWYNKSESRWTIPGCGSCYFFSMDRPSTSRGGTFDLGIADELQDWPEGAYESVFEPIMQKVQGRIVGFGTPNTVSPFNDFHDIIMSGMDYPDNSNSYIIPAWGSDLVDGKLVQGISKYSKYMCTEGIFPTFQSVVDSFNRSRRKDRWRIEYLCHFISAAGGQFDNIEACCSLKPILKYE